MVGNIGGFLGIFWSIVQVLNGIFNKSILRQRQAKGIIGTGIGKKI
jgi:hypothetical protein